MKVYTEIFLDDGITSTEKCYEVDELLKNATYIDHGHGWHYSVPSYVKNELLEFADDLKVVGEHNIDIFISSLIDRLNRKGYKTEFSCSGHKLREHWFYDIDHREKAKFVIYDELTTGKEYFYIKFLKPYDELKKIPVISHKASQRRRGLYREIGFEDSIHCAYPIDKQFKYLKKITKKIEKIFDL